MKYFKYAFVSIIFCLLIFGLYKAIDSKEFALSLVILSVLFMFSFLMMKAKAIKNFHIGGDKLSVSVNEDQDDPKT